MKKDKYICPYIRGTTKEYGTDENGGFWGQNGYNCIEAGYLVLDEKGKSILEVVELIPCADVITLDGLSIAMDCLGEGYLRIFSRDKDNSPLRWESERIPLSDMRLVYGEPTLPEKETS